MNFLQNMECEDPRECDRPEIEHENSMENPSENTIDELRKTRDYFINFRRSYETLELCAKKDIDNFIEIQQRLETTLYNAITDKNHLTIQ